MAKKLAGIDTVIFDANGTLVYNPDEFLLESHGRIFRSLGYPEPDLETCRELWWSHRRFKIVEERFGIPFDVYYPKFKVVMDDGEIRRTTSKPYPDNIALDALAEARIKMAILTNAPPQVAQVEAPIVSPHFNGNVFSSHEYAGFRPKPDPNSVYHVLKTLHAKKAILVGNGDEDMQVAINAGIVPVRMDRGEHPYTNQGEKYLVRNFHELVDLLGL